MEVNLVFFKKDGERRDISLEKSVAVLGRRPECDIRIPLAHVSRKHCRIVERDGQTLVQDLGSTNGTYVNSERIMEAVVEAGDRLRVGSIVFVVQIDGEPAEVPQPQLVESAVAAEGASDSAGREVVELPDAEPDLSHHIPGSSGESATLEGHLDPLGGLDEVDLDLDLDDSSA